MSYALVNFSTVHDRLRGQIDQAMTGEAYDPQRYDPAVASAVNRLVDDALKILDDYHVRTLERCAQHGADE